MSELAKKDCVPCRGGVPPLSGDRIVEPLGQLDGWKVELEHHLSKTYTFPDFAEALAFVNRVGAIAERSDRRSCGWPQVDNVRLAALACSSGGGVDQIALIQLDRRRVLLLAPGIARRKAESRGASCHAPRSRMETRSSVECECRRRVRSR